MIFVQTQPLTAIKLNHDELVELFFYLVRCEKEGFSGIHRYHAHKERERMYQFHLSEVFLKVAKKYDIYKKSKITLKLNEIELHTLSVMFKRVDCTAYMLQLQTRFIKNLVKMN